MNFKKGDKVVLKKDYILDLRKPLEKSVKKIIKKGTLGKIIGIGKDFITIMTMEKYIFSLYKNYIDKYIKVIDTKNDCNKKHTEIEIIDELYNIQDREYRIFYAPIKICRFNIRPEVTDLKEIKGRIKRFDFGDKVMIDTKKGLQIINFCQIVEMVTI